MSIFDIVCLLILIGGIIIGAARGLLSQAASVIGIIVAIILCRVFSGVLAGAFIDPTDNADTQLLYTVLSYAIIFVVVMIVFRLFSEVISDFFEMLELGIFDNIAGAVFAVLEYTMIFSVFLNLWIAIFPSGELRSSYSDKLPKTVIDMAPAVLGSETVKDIFGGISAATDSLESFRDAKFATDNAGDADADE